MAGVLGALCLLLQMNMSSETCRNPLRGQGHPLQASLRALRQAARVERTGADGEEMSARKIAKSEGATRTETETKIGIGIATGAGNIVALVSGVRRLLRSPAIGPTT
mmetsp:Transcript_81322/g.217456  ORF Transcript_81322/g.217456 Transcript_81322/m.217456 type:complete len:107 (+) Transcript_81322:870-1190(+)